MCSWIALLHRKAPSATTADSSDTSPRTVEREEDKPLLQPKSSPRTEPPVTSVEVLTTLLVTAKPARSSVTLAERLATSQKTALLEVKLVPRPATTAVRQAIFPGSVRSLSSNEMLSCATSRLKGRQRGRDGKAF